MAQNATHGIGRLEKKEREKKEGKKQLGEAGKNISDKMDRLKKTGAHTESSDKKGEKISANEPENTLTKLKNSLEKTNGTNSIKQHSDQGSQKTDKELRTEAGKLVDVLFNKANITASEKIDLTNALIEMTKQGQMTRFQHERELSTMDKNVVKEARELAESMSPILETLEKNDLTYSIAKLISRRNNGVEQRNQDTSMEAAVEKDQSSTPASSEDISAKLVESSENNQDKEKKGETSGKTSSYGIKIIEKKSELSLSKEELERDLKNSKKKVEQATGKKEPYDVEKGLKEQGVVLHHETAKNASLSDLSYTVLPEKNKDKIYADMLKSLGGKVDLPEINDIFPQEQQQSEEEKTDSGRRNVDRRNIRTKTNILTKQPSDNKEKAGDTEPLNPEEWNAWMAKFDRPPVQREGIESPSAPLSIINGPSELSKARNDIKNFKIGGIPLLEAAKKYNPNGELKVLVLPGEKILSFDVNGKISPHLSEYMQGTIGGVDNPFFGAPSTNLSPGKDGATYVLLVGSRIIYNAKTGEKLEGKFDEKGGGPASEVIQSNNYGIFYNARATYRVDPFVQDIKGQQIIVIRVVHPKNMTEMRQNGMPDAPGVLGQFPLSLKADEYLKIQEVFERSIKYLPESFKDTFKSLIKDIPETVFGMFIPYIAPDPLQNAAKRMGEVFSMGRSAQTTDEIEACAQIAANIIAQTTVSETLSALTKGGIKAGLKIYGKYRSENVLGKIAPEKPGLKMGRGEGGKLRQHLYKDGEHAQDFVRINGMEDVAHNISLYEEALAKRYTVREKKNLQNHDVGELTSELAWSRTREALEKQGKNIENQPSSEVHRMVREEEAKLGKTSKESLINELAEIRGSEAAFLAASTQYNKNVILQVAKEALTHPDTVLYESDFHSHPDFGGKYLGRQYNLEYTTKTGHRARISWREDGQILNALDIKREGTVVGSKRDGSPLRVPNVKQVYRNPRFIIGDEQKWLDLNRRIDADGRLVSETGATVKQPIEHADTLRMDTGRSVEQVNTELFTFLKDNYYKGDAEQANTMLRNVYEYDIKHAIKSGEFRRRFNEKIGQGDGSVKTPEMLKIINEVDEWYYNKFDLPKITKTANELKSVPLADIPVNWQSSMTRANEDVKIYRGFPRNIERHASEPINSDIGGQASRSIEAANDAVFNQYGKDPVLEGHASRRAGLVEITIPRDVWNTLIEKRQISERAYSGFSGSLKSTELRINSQHAADIINECKKRILEPDDRYDYRPATLLQRLQHD